MVLIQFPEFLRSATLLICTYVATTVNKANQKSIEIYNNDGQCEDKIECEVLYEPAPGTTKRGDVVIVHGLHGSTYKTWRQGVYEYNKVHKTHLRISPSASFKNINRRICSKCKSNKQNHLNDDRNNSLQSEDSNSESESELSVTKETNQQDKNVDSKYDIDVSHNEKQLNGVCENLTKINCDPNLVPINNNIINRSDGVEPKPRDNNSRNYKDNQNDLDEMCRNLDTAFRNACNGKIDNSTEDVCFCSDTNNFLITKTINYKEVYGDGPILIRKMLFFLVKFLINIFYSIYRKMWDLPEDGVFEKNSYPSECWPRDWIPMDCPYVRIISINYTTSLWTPIWVKSCNRTSLQEKALEMARQLKELGVGKQPIIWAAHSKGGLFIKQMFIDSWREREGASRDLFINTNTIVFYSVPQHGSVLAHLFTSPFIRPSIEIVEVRTGSRMVHQLHCEFIEALKASSEIRKIKMAPSIVSYTETIPTNMNGILVQIVFPTTADPGVGDLYGIPLDHRMICKFASRDSVLYQDLVKLIEQTCRNHSKS